MPSIQVPTATMWAGLDARVTALEHPAAAPVARGPKVASSFVTVDFATPLAGAGTVVPECFGVASGGLGNANFHDLAADANGLSEKIAALDPGLFRLNSNWHSRETIDLSVLLAHYPFPHDMRIVVGIDHVEVLPFVMDQLEKLPRPPEYLEYENEPVDPGSDSYNAGFTDMVTRARAVLPAVQGAGPVSAGLNTGAMKGLFAQTGDLMGLADFHQYLYCEDTDKRPSDVQVLLGRNAAGIGVALMWANAIDLQAGLPADMPVLLGEFANECDASPIDLRAGTSLGCGLYLAQTLGGQTSTSRPWWTAWWDLYDDAGAAYQLIDRQGGRYPVYYLIQRLRPRAPGQMVTVRGKPSLFNVWGTQPVDPTQAGFCVALVNGATASQGGQVALSQVPVNAAGTFQAKFWSYPTNTSGTPMPDVPGTEIIVDVVNGLAGPVMVPAMSVGVLSLS